MPHHSTLPTLDFKKNNLMDKVLCSQMQDAIKQTKITYYLL